MSAPTLEELEFWRGLTAAARDVVDRPSLAAAAKLAKLGEKARKVRVPVWKQPGRLELFARFASKCRSYAPHDADQLLQLAGDVDAAVEEALTPPLPPAED